MQRWTVIGIHHGKADIWHGLDVAEPPAVRCGNVQQTFSLMVVAERIGLPDSVPVSGVCVPGAITKVDVLHCFKSQVRTELSQSYDVPAALIDRFLMELIS